MRGGTIHMGDSHSHHTFGWLLGSVSTAGLAAKLAEHGWTPEALTAFLAAVTTTIMAAAQLLKAGLPYYTATLVWLGKFPPPPPAVPAAPAVPE